MSTTTPQEANFITPRNNESNILTINGRKAVATKNLVNGFEITKTAFDLMWVRNQNDFFEDHDWNWYNSVSLQIVSHKNSPKVSRIFYSKGVSKASTKFNSPKAKEFAQKMFDNYASQIDGESKLVKSEAVANFILPNFSNPAEAARAWADEIEAKTRLTLENSELKPKADYFDTVVNQNPENLSVVETTSRFLNQEKGIKISYPKVWEIMRENKWLIYQKKYVGSTSPAIPFPSQNAKEKGWLTTTEEPGKSYNKEGLELNFINTQILITPKGRLELLKLIQKGLENQKTSKLI